MLIVFSVRRNPRKTKSFIFQSNFLKNGEIEILNQQVDVFKGISAVRFCISRQKISVGQTVKYLTVKKAVRPLSSQPTAETLRVATI